MLRLFTKSYIRDFEWLELAFKSVLHYCKEPIEWFVVVDDPDADKCQEIINTCMEWCGQRKDVTFWVHGVNEKWPDTAEMTGYYRQQGIKMTINRITDGLVWNWDSDVIAQRPFTHKDFLGKSERPIYFFSHFNELMKSGGPDNAAHEARRALLKSIFQMEWCHFEFMRCQPLPIFTEVLVHGERSEVWKRAFQLLKESNPAISEFNIIGQFAHLLFPDAFEWVNAETAKETFSGGYKEGGTGSGGFDGIHLVSQGWSWGGLPENVKNWVNGLRDKK